MKTPPPRTGSGPANLATIGLPAPRWRKTRSESQGDPIGRLRLVAAEQLRDLAGGQADEIPKVSGTKVHGPCPHCDEDGPV